MWPAQKQHTTAMTSQLLPVARPWTPPEMDSDDSSPMRCVIADLHASTVAIADSGYFGDGAHATSDQARDTWSRPESSSSDRSHPPSRIPTRRRPNTTKTQNTAGERCLQERPYTPTKSTEHSPELQYPNTPPDSARMPIQRAQTYDDASPLPMSPLPSRLWASSSPDDRKRTSPVQNALFSCLNNLERLIGTSQPGAEQMEYIIEQFETMTAYLSAPDAQTKGSDDHLFSELEPSVPSVNGVTAESPALTKDEAEAYVAEVGKFIEGVKAHAAEMKERLDEVKQLNELNVHVIADLQKEVRVGKETITELSKALSASQETIADLDEELSASHETIAKLHEESCQRTKALEPIAEVEQEPEIPAGGLIASISGALDFVSDLLYEW